MTNYRDGETIRYPVALLKGNAGGPADADGQVAVVNTSSTRDTRDAAGAVHRGRFKALAELVPGENRLRLRHGNHEIALKLVYKPQDNPYFVRAIYLTDSTGDTTYQAPVGDVQDYQGRLDTALKLMQTLTAERMNDLGFGRVTFNLEFDEAGKVKVHVAKGAKPAAFYYALNDQAWYAAVARELDKPYPTRLAKNFVVAAYTRFDPQTHKTQGHTALGGGGQGLFGSGDMFTWPARLADAQAALTDGRRIDRDHFMDDSAGRGTYWGAAATTIGACLHETGHAFGLPHTREPLDVMTRGFDRLNRAFTLYEPPRAPGGKPVEFDDASAACFAPISAAALAPSRWFALDARPYGADRDDVTARLVGPADGPRQVEVTAQFPVRYIGFSTKGEAVYYQVPAAGQRKVSVPLADVVARTGGGPFRVRVVDDQGIISLPQIPETATTNPAK